MGKGGIDLSICAQLRSLMDHHPYDPQGMAEEVPEPYLLEDAIRALYPRLTDDELVRMLFRPSSYEVHLPQASMPLREAVAMVVRSVMRAHASEDEGLLAENTRRRQLYESRRWPSGLIG